MYRVAPPEPPPERACEVEVTRAAPGKVAMLAVVLVPLFYAVKLVLATWWLVPTMLIPIGVVTVVFIIPAASSSFVRVEPDRRYLELRRRVFGVTVRTERHSLEGAKAIEVYHHESEDEADTFMVYLVYSNRDSVPLGEMQGGAVVQGEIEAAVRTLRAYVFPPDEATR